MKLHWFLLGVSCGAINLLIAWVLRRTEKREGVAQKMIKKVELGQFFSPKS